MTHSSPTIAWHNGVFISTDRLHVGVDDIGFRQSVIAVERLRTYHGKVTALEAHVVRWRRTLEELYLTTPVVLNDIQARIAHLLSENRGWLNDVGDCGIVMLATPGMPGRSDYPYGNEWIHLIPIDHAKIAQHQTAGQPLFITNVEQPSSRCWPRDIKVRCRLHYYLADQQAREHHPDAVGLLIDQDGTITETSVANIAIVRGGQILTPPSDQVLPGITQQIVQQACHELGLPWQCERLWPAEIREADEVWLMGTDGGLWFANRVDGGNIGKPLPGPMYRRVMPVFQVVVGNDLAGAF